MHVIVFVYSDKYLCSLSRPHLPLSLWCR